MVYGSPGGASNVALCKSINGRRRAGILIGKQRRQRHIDKVGIAKLIVVGHRQFDGFRHHMHIIGRKVALL